MPDIRDEYFKGRCLCLVAHPDDEVLWAGGLLQKGDWTVIACSIPRIDPVRAFKFFDCCDVLGVKSRILPFSEIGPGVELPHLDVLKDYLWKFDTVLTHNVYGEYGHIQHRQLNRWVRENYEGKICTFGYGGGTTQTYKLTALEVMQKEAALARYNHVLPYNGRRMTKWEALLERYMKDQDLSVESFIAL